MMAFSTMILLKNDEKDWKSLLISMCKKCFLCLSVTSYLLYRVAGHPLAQDERSLHVFLQEEKIDHDRYVPGKVRNR